MSAPGYKYKIFKTQNSETFMVYMYKKVTLFYQLNYQVFAVEVKFYRNYKISAVSQEFRSSANPVIDVRLI